MGWTELVELVERGIVATGNQLWGSRGGGILAFAFLVRLMAAPLLVPFAARTREHQRIVKQLRPEIKALNTEFKDDPSRLSKELKELHRKQGIQVVDWPGLAVALVQVLILIILFQAVLHTVEGTSLAEGGWVFGATAAILSLSYTRKSTPPNHSAWLLWVAAALPILISVWLGRGVGLYLTGFYGASVVQALLTGGQKVQESGFREGRPG